MASSSSVAASAAATRQIVVLGGNGYVGSHILQELVRRKQQQQQSSNSSSQQQQQQPLRLKSLSRSGAPSQPIQAWMKEVEWQSVDVSTPSAALTDSIRGSSAVISCIGGFGSVAAMEKINGDTNVNAIQAAKATSVPRFVYISAHHYALPSVMQRGYFAGKFHTEEALTREFGENGVQIRPGFIHGTRQVKGVGLPLWMVGVPLQKLTTLGFVRSLTQMPLIGPVLSPILTPPVSVEAVARAAVDAALAEKPIKSTIDVDDLLQYESK